MNSGNGLLDTGAGDPFLFDLTKTITGGDVTATAKDGLGNTMNFSLDTNPHNPQDGTGDWQYGIVCPTCHGGSQVWTELDIKITLTGIQLADFIANNLGNAFAFDICVGTEVNRGKNILQCSANGPTGDAVVTQNGIPVPEPISLSLFGVGLVAMGAFGRRRRKNIPAA